MFQRARYLLALVALFVMACLSDPVGPGVLAVAIVGGSADTVWIGAPGEVLPRAVRVVVTDDAGNPVPAAMLAWEAVGAGASVVSASVHSDAAGQATAAWRLGTNAAEEQRLRVRVQTRRQGTEIELRARAVPYVVSALRIVGDTILRVGDTLDLQVNAIDPYGNVFPAPHLLMGVDDSSIGAAMDSRIVGGPRRGRGIVMFGSHGVAAELPLHVTQFVAAIVPAQPAVQFSSLGAVVPVSYIVHDDRGRVVEDTAAILSVSDTSVVQLEGTQLRSRSPGDATLELTLGSASVAVPLDVEQRIATLALAADTVTFDALLDTTTFAVVGYDALGALVADASGRTTYVSTAPHVLGVTADGRAQTIGNGTASVIAQSSDGPADTMLVTVSQRVASIELNRDSVLFESLQAEASLSGRALDRLGSAIDGVAVTFVIDDPSIAQLEESGVVRALRNGATRVIASAEGVSAPVPIRVAQRAVSLDVQLQVATPIVMLPVGAVLPLQCTGYDANRFAVPEVATLTATVNATVTGVACGDIRVARSGVDTLRFVSGGAQASVLAVIAVPPVPDSPLGTLISADSIPAPAGPWAPSVGRGPNGGLALYYAVFAGVPDSSGMPRGDLHRLEWLGGAQFRYDSIVLRHDDSICSPQGQGIENVAVVPRTDGAGWRMFYAAGSNQCYGWQVFSATSDDGRTWVKEPGVRLGNGGIDSTFPPPWPAGEGMVVDQLPNGYWRMIVSTFEHVTPPEANKWQITEWRSSDQLQWQYTGTVLTTRDMPAGWQGSVYSPTIRQVAPGLWRMLFTADGRGTTDSRSAIWSAVSTDRSTWQLEGEVIGAIGANVYYSVFLDDRVVFVRLDPDGQLRLATVTMAMP